MKQIFRAIILLASFIVLFGCATSGAKYAELNPTIPLKPDTGRIFIDRVSGSYEIMTSTEVDRKLSLTLDKGEARFVRLNISMGFFAGHVYPELIDPATGEKEIQDCRYTGK
jgi:hypothetical protein